MNQFSKSEEELVEVIHLEILAKIIVMACSGVAKYAEKEDRHAAAGAVIAMVKERLNANP